MKSTWLSLLGGLAVVLAPAWAHAGNQGAADVTAGDEMAVASAQAPQRGITGGLLGGVAFADLGGSADANVFGMTMQPPLEVTQGLSAGGFVALQLDPRWGARVELRYAQRGATAAAAITGSAGSLPVPFDLQLAYLQVPVLATLAIPYDDGFVPYLFAGPDLALLLSAEIAGQIPMVDDEGNPQLDEDGNIQTMDITRDVEEGVSSFDLGVTVGAGMKFPLSRGRLVLDVRYTLGILEVADGNEVALIDGLVSLTPHHLRHRLLMLTAAYEL